MISYQSMWHWIDLKKFFFLSLLFCIFFSYFYFHLHEYLAISHIKKSYIDIQQWIIIHYLLAVSLYILIYIALIACAIPCATILALLGGFFFGNIAVIYAVLSTTLGGTILFLLVRTSLGSRIASKSTGWIKKVERGFQQNAFHYILTLRLMPIFPCWISNIAAGMLNVSLKIFVSATILGILPATLIYVLAGQSLDKFFFTEESILLHLTSNPSIFFSLLGLAILSLFPVIYKHVKKQ